MSQVQAYCAHSVARLQYVKVRTSPTCTYSRHSHVHAYHTPARTYTGTRVPMRLDPLRSHRVCRAICLANIFSLPLPPQSSSFYASNKVTKLWPTSLPASPVLSPNSPILANRRVSIYVNKLRRYFAPFGRYNHVTKVFENPKRLRSSILVWEMKNISDTILNSIYLKKNMQNIK